MKYTWVLLALLAALATATGTVFLKLVDKTNFDNEFILAMVFIFMGIFSFIYLLFNNKILLTNWNKCSNITLIILISYALFIIFEYKLIINALKYSPNIGFTRTIMNLNIVATLLISYLFFKEKIKKECFFGILLCIIGITIIVYYNNK